MQDFDGLTPEFANPPLPRLAPRAADGHKGTYGRVLLIGGSRGMSGAIALAGRAALRSGAGLVRLAVPDVCLETVAGFEPCYTTIPLPHDRAGRLSAEAQTGLAELLTNADCFACGPGLGRSPELDQLVRWLFAEAKLPAVFDADALNALADLDTWPAPSGPRILTPHPGEFRRLLRTPTATPQAMRDRVLSFSRERQVITVLKGHRSLVTDGQIVTENKTGNPGMATGGSGDVLTGIVAALLGQGLSAFDAARLGVHVHGLAGDRAAEQLGQVSLIASDLIAFLPAAFVR